MNPCEPAGCATSRRATACRSASSRRSARRSSARWSRSRWSGTGSAAGPRTNLLIFLPMATPEVVHGGLAADAVRRPPGCRAGLLDDPDRAHHVLPVVRGGDGEGPAGRPGPDARAGGDGPLRQRGQTFRRVTLPLVLPGHPRRPRCWRSRCRSTTSSSRTSTRGNAITFPMFVWGAAQRGIPPQVNVIGTAMFFVALSSLVAGAASWRRQRRRRCLTVPAAPARSADASAGRLLARRPRRARPAPAGAGRRRRRRPRGGRRRLHRAVDRAAGQGARPVARRGAARGRRLRLGGQSGRNGGFCVGQPDPRARQRPRALARRDADAGAARRRRTSRGIEATVARLRHRLRLRAHRRAHVATEPWQVDELRERGRAGAAPGTTSAAGPGRGAGRGRLADLPRRVWDPDGVALVDPARLAWGLRAALPRRRRPDLRGHPGHRPRSADGRRVARADAGRRGPRAPGGARHQRLPVAAAPAAAATSCRSTTTC